MEMEAEVPDPIMGEAEGPEAANRFEKMAPVRRYPSLRKAVHFVLRHGFKIIL
jgi:hypothetical protein